MKKQGYFHIEPSMIADKAVFPFHIYVYNPMTAEYSPFLWGNDPLIKSKREILDFIVEKGGSIAVSLGQKNTFLGAMDLTEDQVPSLAKKVERQDDLEAKSAAGSLKDIEEKEGKFNFQSEFKKCVDQDNFKPMIQRARLEITSLSVRINHTVSLARMLADTLLYRDNLVNRVVAVSYFMAKVCGVNDPESLGDLVCSSFFSHLGATQLDFTIWQKPAVELFDKERKAYRQHAGLSQHLLRKSGVELSDRCMKVILEHHERYDGSGYPDEKKGEHLDVLSMILGAVSHIMEFHEGKVTGAKMAIPALLVSFKEKTPLPGLEFQFGPLVEENIAYLLKVDEATGEVGTSVIKPDDKDDDSDTTSSLAA